MNDQPIVGDWRFDTASAALTQPGCTKRLEDRSARTLALLCRRRGEVVSKADILAKVWQGRTVSDNSVAIVIAALRRALGESSRAPHHIETIGKRGYRLRAAPDVPAEPERADPGGARSPRRLDRERDRCRGCDPDHDPDARDPPPPPPIALMLGPVRNDTGDGRYDPLARSLAALVEERAARMPEGRRHGRRLAGRPTSAPDDSWKCGPV